MTENEEIIAASYGKSDSIDISTESLEFDIAAVLGRVVSNQRLHCRRGQRFISKLTIKVDILWQLYRLSALS